MKEFFDTFDLGKMLKKNSIKLNQRYKGQAVYKVTNQVNDYLKKGYHFYLDSLHFDHLEIYDMNGHAKFVLNLDGSPNIIKTKSVLGRKIEV